MVPHDLLLKGSVGLFFPQIPKTMKKDNNLFL